MAAEQQLLEQLVDIAEPAYQLPLQIPPGAYILLAVAAAALGYFGWLCYKHWRNLAAKRQAIVLLNQFEPAAAAQINQLLKRVVKHYAPAHPVLTASTAQWQRFLQQQLPDKPLPLLSTLLYQTGADNQQQQQFYQFAQCWLHQLQPATLTDSRNQTVTEEVTDA